MWLRVRKETDSSIESRWKAVLRTHRHMRGSIITYLCTGKTFSLIEWNMHQVIMTCLYIYEYCRSISGQLLSLVCYNLIVYFKCMNSLCFNRCFFLKDWPEGLHCQLTRPLSHPPLITTCVKDSWWPLVSITGGILSTVNYILLMQMETGYLIKINTHSLFNFYHQTGYQTCVCRLSG